MPEAASATDLALAFLGTEYGSVLVEATTGRVRVRAGSDGVFEGETVEQALVRASDRLLAADIARRVRGAVGG